MFKFDAWVVPESKIFKPAFRKKVGYLTPPKIPIADNLLHRYEGIDINTGRKEIWLELKLEDFEEIKKFWITEYADSELYQTIKEIIDLTSSNEHIYKKFCNHFRRLIHGNLIAFTTDFKESKEIYLIYWLNFIYCFIKQCLLKYKEKLYLYAFNPSSKKDLIKNWRELRNCLIHPNDFNKKLELIKFNSDKSCFKITIKNKKLNTNDELTFSWKDFFKFRTYFLDLLKKKICEHETLENSRLEF